MADIVIINPRFEPSYWGMDHLLPFMGKAANLPVASLPLLAALTPEEHTVTLIDESVQEIDFDRCAKADIVAMTGMSVQRFRMKEIMTELKARGCFVVLGGPWITVQEDYFDDEPADAIFIGEAEETWPQFLREWKQGLNQYRYEQLQKTDMSKVTTPRFDMLDMKRYAFGSLQFSRGCPFQCEFCDIIVTFGRRPRIKTNEQVIAELEAIWKTGMRIAFVVDDNLIGNKKAIKLVLKDVIAWQKKHGYPLSLFTEASIDLADDPELMDLMTEANFVAVFIGIESPNEEALRETKKFQNVRQGGTLLEKIRRIQDAGMAVWCGMIMGFDSDDHTIFDRQVEFIQKSRISFSMSGMLAAIPKTPLHARLAEEGRLDLSDRPEFGTNVIPLKMSREELLSGYFDVIGRLYDPKAYFERTDALFLDPNFEIGITKKKKWWRISPRWAISEAKSAVEGLVLYARLVRNVSDPELKREYRQRFKNFVKVHRRPGLVMFYVLHMAMHYHSWTMAQNAKSGARELVNVY
ncbi:B12-binding domain-containing radical SAM protein [Paludisphaera rhizosphaerae]|uniref:B12-binding domain-containing radical SAM protein n=1 Tax=Paludisphaera rhizosphaerae TaxID=2711216 RepID=UPI0013E9AE00|nr:B12-binding domain-containing radical SAM protein [Paludisphaera rhizosphaerae]